MVWQPEQPPPDPEVILGHLEAAPDESSGYIQPEDVAAITSALMSRDEATLGMLASTQAALGDIHHVTPSDLATFVGDLDARVADLAGRPEPPALEGEMILDRYSGTFVRARFDGASWPTLDLADGQDHWIKFVIGPAGNGGAAFADTAELASVGGVVWYDHGGALGHVRGANGQDASAAAMRTWIDTQKHVRVRHSMEGTHPVLTVLELADQAADAAPAGLAPRLGDWTPEVRGNRAIVPGIAYLSRGGWYVRLGPLVYAQGYVMLAGKGTPSSGDPYLQVHGLPFPTRMGSDMHALVQVHPCEDVTKAGIKGWDVMGRLDNGEQHVDLLVPGTGNLADRLKHSDVGADFVVRVAAVYITEAP